MITITIGDKVLKREYDFNKKMEDECLYYQTKFDTALRELFTKMNDKKNVRHCNTISTKMFGSEFEKFRQCKSYGKTVDLLKKNGYDFYLLPMTTTHYLLSETVELLVCDLMEIK